MRSRRAGYGRKAAEWGSDEQQEACANLRAILKPGQTVYTTLRHVSSSGMFRVIQVLVPVRDSERTSVLNDEPAKVGMIGYPKTGPNAWTDSKVAEVTAASDLVSFRSDPGIFFGRDQVRLYRHKPVLAIQDISGLAADATSNGWDDRGGVRVGGCGMDMGFHIVYTLGHAMWPNGTRKPHGTRNGEPDTAGGYALKHKWA